MDSTKTTRKSILKKGTAFALTYIAIKWLILGTIGTILYKSGHWRNWYLVFVPIIGIGVMLVRKYRNKKQEQ